MEERREVSYEEALEQLDQMYKKYQGRSVVHDESAIKAWVPWIRGLILGSTQENGKIFVKNLILTSIEYNTKSLKRLSEIFELHLNREPTDDEKDTLLNVVKFYEPFEEAKTIVENLIMSKEEYISSHPVRDKIKEKEIEEVEE